jgi:AsmA protein
MPRWIKLSLIALLTLFALVVLVLVVVAATFDPNAFKPQLVELVRAKTQRTLGIPGRIELSFFPNLGAELGAASLSERGSSAPFASVQSARVSLALLPLFKREFVVDRVRVQGLRATVRRFKDGRTNIDDLLGDKQEDATEGSGGTGDIRLAIAGVDVQRSLLVFDDAREGRRVELAVDNLRSGRVAPGATTPVELDAHVKADKPRLDAALMGSAKVRLDPGGPAVDAATLVAKGRLDDEPFDLALDVRQLVLGDMWRAPKVDARLTRGKEMNAHLTLAGVSGNAQATRATVALTVDGSASGRSFKAAADGSANVSLEKKTAALDLKGKLDDGGFTAKVWLDRFAPLALRFDVALDTLDAGRYAVAAGAAASAPAGHEKPLDLSALKELDARGTLRVGALSLAGLRASEVRVDARAAGGRVELAPLSAKLYGGSMNGTATLVAGGPPRVTVRQTLADVSVGALLKDLTAKQPVDGRGRLVLDLSTQGGLASALKKNLAGSVRLELRDGAVRGVDLGEIIRIAKGTGTSSAAQQTPFTTLDATFRVAAGVARNDDLVAASPLMRITGSGEIDLVDERVDYLAKATLTNDALGKLQGRTVPVRLRGPFASIGYSVDVGAVVQEEVKRKVEKELVDKLKGILGR